MVPRPTSSTGIRCLLVVAIAISPFESGCLRLGLAILSSSSDGDVEQPEADAVHTDADVLDDDACPDAERDDDERDADPHPDVDEDDDASRDADTRHDTDVEPDREDDVTLEVSFDLLSPPSSPTGRRTSGALERGATNDRFWVFGGFNGSTQTGLFCYDTAIGTWERVPEGDAEAARQGHVMGWDEECGKLVVFGGSSGASDERNDVRVFDPSTSTFTSPATDGGPPTARCFSSFLWVPHQGRFLLIGGSNALLTTFFGDLWSLELDATCDTATWTELSPVGDVPPGRAGACAVYDEVRHVVIDYGGQESDGESADLFELDVDALTWTLVETEGDFPGANAFCATSFHDDLGVMLVYGGQQGLLVVGTTYLYDPLAHRWTRLSPATTPGNRGDVAAVFSPRLGRALYFGGRYVSLGGLVSHYVDETWSVRVVAVP